MVNGELLGLPFLIAGILAYVAAAASRHQVRGFLLSLAAGAAGAIAALVKQSMVDVFVVAAVLLFTSGAARRKLPGLLAGALVTIAVVVAAAWARGTVPADLWDAVVTFRVDAARELAGDSGNAPARLAGLVGALAASGVPLVVAAFAWKGRGAPSRPGPWTAPDLRVAAYALLTFELLVAFLGGSYWLHYLMGLVPGAVLFAAAFAQRPAPVTRSIGGSLALAGVSAVAALGWVAAHPIDRPEEQAIAYLDDHAQRGDSAVVVLGAANVVRDAHLEASYPYLWSLPARVRDADLATLDGLLESDRAADLGDRRPSGRSTTGSSTSPTRSGCSTPTTTRWTRPASSPSTAAPTHDPQQDRAHPRGGGVRRRPVPLVLAGRHPQRPDRCRALALAARDLLAARLVLAVPEGLVAVAAGPRGLRPGARRHRRHRLHALRGVADPRRRVAGPPLGRRRRPTVSLQHRFCGDPCDPQRPGAVVRHRRERDVRLTLRGRPHHRRRPLASRPRRVRSCGSAAT